MEVIEQSRGFFLKPKEPKLSLGVSNYLLTVVLSIHIAFGTLLISEHYLGTSLQCYKHDSEPQITDICKSQFHYLPIGAETAAKYKKEELPLTFAYFKLTNWIFLCFGKIQLLFYFILFKEYV